ncbi:VanZ family protein [Gemmatimonadota bacterium]
MLKLRITTSFYLAIALTYSWFIFFIASRLPVWTKKWAAALSWVVYVEVIKSLMMYGSVVLLFILFISWFSMRHKWRFLALCAAYLVILILLLAHLGNSVNEYVHFPEYATCVLLWYAVFSHQEQNTQTSGKGSDNVPLLRGIAPTPLHKAILIGLFLGVMDELYQAYLPQRVFDLYDILLNFMGVWLGGMLIWIITKKKTQALSGHP